MTITDLSVNFIINNLTDYQKSNLVECYQICKEYKKRLDEFKFKSHLINELAIKYNKSVRGIEYILKHTKL